MDKKIPRLPTGQILQWQMKTPKPQPKAQSLATAIYPHLKSGAPESKVKPQPQLKKSRW